MPKYAALSDIHGNLDALEAVLEDSTNRGVEAIWFLGDLLDPGPHPARVFDRIQYLLNRPKAVWLAGNHDRSLAWMKNDQFQAKSKICYDKMGDSYRSFAEITRDAIKEASILKAADRPTQQRFEHHISPGIFMAHGFPNPDVLQACMEYDFNLAPLGSRGGEIEEIRNQVAPNTQLWLIGHSHRQSAWWFDGQTWNELSPGFGTDLEGHTRSIVPNNNTPTVLMQTEIDFQQYPISSLLILNPGSVGFPRDGIVLKDFGVNLAKYLILELNDSKLKVTFCAVPYMFAKESSDVWRAWYPAEVFNMLAIGQDDLSREEIPV